MKIISNILFFILMAIMLTASGMLCVLGWLIYPVLWLCHRYDEWDRYKLHKGHDADLRRMAREIVRIVKQQKKK